MDVTDIVSREYVEFTPETKVSKLAGVFEDPSVTGVVVAGDEFAGVVTRRQLATSRHPPDQTVGSLVQHVPRLDPDEDVRRVAQLMIDGGSKLLPVVEGGTVTGVVTADDVIRAVQPFLDAATVAQAMTPDVVSLDPDATLGEALHDFREHRITHLPVVEEGAVVGILSLYDVTGLTVRSIERSQGGDASGTDAFGGGLSESAGRSRGGGYGAREGELERILELPVADVMTSPVRTVARDETLDVAVDAMFDVEGSALVVTADGSPVGVVTKTDVLDSLTWEAGGSRSVQLYGSDLLDDMSYDEVVAMIDGLDDRDHGMNVIDARIHLHEHDETLRGTPLLLARVRLHTDGGQYVASGEGYGARHAISEARDVLERRIRDRKTRGKTKKHPDEAFWERRFGWLLEA